MESITNPDQLPNIKNMVVERPVAVDQPFDPETLLSSEEWGMMMAEVEQLKVKRYLWMVAELVMSLAILRPDFRKQFTRDDELLRFLEGQIVQKSYIGSRTLNEALISRGQYQLISLHPESLRMEVDELLIQEANVLLRRSRAFHLRSEFDQFTTIAFYSSVAFPGRKSDLDITLSDGKCILKFLRNWEKNAHDIFSLQEIADIGACHRSVWSNQAWKPGEHMWNKMRQAFNTLRLNEQWKKLAKFGSDLKILAAESVEITSNGLDIVMPSKSRYTVPDAPIPEVRKF